MFHRFPKTTKMIVVSSFVLAFCLIYADANSWYTDVMAQDGINKDTKPIEAKKKEKDKDNEDNGNGSYDGPSTVTYYDEGWIDWEGGTITINRDAKVTIRPHALEDYLAEIDQDSVLITCQMVEVYDINGNLDRLDFTFGPSGAYFEPELRLILKRDYLLVGFVLYSESGEILESSTKKNSKQTTHYIPHFSRYAYDMYDY